MKKRKIMAWLLTGLMSFESIFASVMPVTAAGETEAVAEAEAEETASDDTAADETASGKEAAGETEADVDVEEESFVRIEKVDPSEETKTQNNLYRNLEKYEQDSSEESVDYAALPVTGINPIMPSEGQVNTILIMTDFADCKFAEGYQEKLAAQMFKPDTEDSVNDPFYPLESLNAYYQRASFGKLSISGDLIAYSSEHERSYYDNQYQDNSPLYQEVLDYWAGQIISGNPADSGVSNLKYLNDYLAKYDSDGDMIIDGCYFVVAGGHTGWSSQWWAYRTSGMRIYIGSYQLPSVIQIVDRMHERQSGLDDIQDTIVVFTHETGHQLGLDDYYSYESDLSKLDTFAMMCTNGGDQDGFAKMLLGWLPEENVHWVSSGETVELRPYAETGDIAIILPEEEKNQYGIYSQFILAEHYKSVKNDVVDEYNRKRRSLSDNSIIVLDQPEEGIRLYHIYARLNDTKDGFVVTNMSDAQIPLIENYVCSSDKDWGFFRSGDELTENTDPTSDFYLDRVGKGMLADTVLENSGISITDIKAVSGNDVLSFKVSFNEDKVTGPQVKEIESGIDAEAGIPYTKLVFDRPVNFRSDIEATVYDLDEETMQPVYDEPWEGKVFIGRDPQYEYGKDHCTLYFTYENARMTDGMLVVPKGLIMSTDGIAADEIMAPVNYMDSMVMGAISFSKPSGVYNEAFEVEIKDIPAGCTVWYTVDGSEPGQGSLVYKDPIQITKNTVVKAVTLYEYEGNLYPVTKRIRAAYSIENVKLDRSELILCEGEYYPLMGELSEDTQFSVESSNPCVFVDMNGWIQAKSLGESVITVKTPSGAKSECKVTVSADAAKEVVSALKNEYGNDYDSVMMFMSQNLMGRMTMAEFEAGGYLNKRWCGSVLEECIYDGSVKKPEVNVFDGVKILTKGKDYKLSYNNKKNKNAGVGEIKVTFLKAYKKEKAQKVDFLISPATLGKDAYPFTGAVAHTGKPQKAKPVFIWAGTGQKVNEKEYDIRYFNEMGREVQKLTDEGEYIAYITPKNDNFTGQTYTLITVKKTDVVEKLKVKKKTKSFKATGQPIYPEYGKDFVITVPKGYDPVDKNGILDPNEVEIYCYNNVLPGKLVMVITDTGKGNYFGTQIVTFNIKK
ncbi:MAG: chitobiase/beta-hexosaminidase C-terminal domain-containing protein [Lachnospiraceae bacterium]|nr:chitobiase/beta-hexosaminidase C-terminal domain-containing protein [Lachnospiraceae bacterium]